jgi:DNA helicase-2/ATP-dependent DNA helicase PcrA
MPAIDLAVAGLTSEQRIAAAARIPNLFIEAEPGSGKTAVASQRFGVLRYLGGPDARGVLAISFTRSATAELRARIRRSWGPSTTQWPHRIATIDYLMRRLLHALLAGGHIEWPGTQIDIEVVDDWRSVTAVSWRAQQPRVSLEGRRVIVNSVSATRRSRPTPSAVRDHISAGVCTHDDIRTVLADAIQVPEIAAVVERYLSATVRAIIVDEVFDANELDLAVFEIAMNAGVEVTIIGDPWQALYGFRGARPQDVPQLVARTDIRTLPLTASFRWKTGEQRQLASDLRAGEGVSLPQGSVPDADVALAGKWQTLWAIDRHILPIAFPPFSDNDEGRAAATLLLNQVTRNAFQIDAAYLGESLKVLGVPGIDVRLDLEPALNAIVLRLQSPDSADDIYRQLSDILKDVTGRSLNHAVVHADRTRIEELRQRVADVGALVPGMTIHQAKGREWDYVAVRLDESETQALGRGLSHGVEIDRKTYVACTRARRRTFSV